MIRILFRCGHDGVFKDGQVPICAACGERGVARCFAPNPRFVGTAKGPLVETKTLEPAVVALAEVPLKLNAPEPRDAE